jgi:excinuclease ABC subunit B
LGAGAWSATEKQEKPIEDSNSQLTYDEPDDVAASLTPDERAALVEELRQAMNEAARDLDFEEAARLRDRVHELERWNDQG